MVAEFDALSVIPIQEQVDAEVAARPRALVEADVAACVDAPPADLEAALLPLLPSNWR